MAEEWQPVEKAAKNDEGKFVVFKDNNWIPAERVAKNAEGKFVAIYKDISPPKEKVESLKKDFWHQKTSHYKLAVFWKPIS